MTLDRAAAELAIDSKARTLGVDAHRAASGMLQVATSAMANVVRHVTLERGLDPRDFTLVAYGGGGGLHAAAVAKELFIRTVIIPQAPGHFSALGMLMADFRRDYVQTLFAKLDDLQMDQLEAAFRELEEAGCSDLKQAGIPPDRIVFERAADMRYIGQEHAVAVRMPSALHAGEARGDIKRLFDEAHEQRFSHSAPDESADVVSLRVSVIGRLAKPDMPEIAKGDKTPPSGAKKGVRPITFDGQQIVESIVWDRSKLLAGNVIDGPAVIEEAASTTVVDPGDRAEVNRFGYLVLTLAAH
jgi:N-methylhydantoinase A